MHRVAYIQMVVWIYAPPPFIIWNNKVKNVKNIAILFKLLLYICWFQKELFFNLFLVFKLFICSLDIAGQFHLKLRWICRPSLALATWTRPDNQGAYLFQQLSLTWFWSCIGSNRVQCSGCECLSQDLQNAAYGLPCDVQGQRCFPHDCMQPTGRDTRSSQAEYGAVLLAGAFW